MATRFYLVSGSAGVTGSAVPILAMRTDRGHISLGGTSSITLTAGGNNIQATNTAGGTLLSWITPPVQRSFTLSGSANMALFGLESNALANSTFGFRLWHKSASLQGTGSETAMMTQVSSSASEFTTTTENRFANSAIVNTSFKIGDRVLLRLYAVSASGTTMGGSRTATLYYGGLNSGSSGDAGLTFTQDLPMKKKLVTHIS